MNTDKDFISLVIPVYNEEENLGPLINSAENGLKGLLFEIIAVDDGSTDGSKQALLKLRERFNNLKTISLKRNFGQTAALAAGIDQAKGGIIVTMDGDGQNDPSDIPALVNKLNEGFDVVSGWRKERKDPLISRKLPSGIANRIISFVTGVWIHDYGCTLKAYKREAIANLQMAGEMHRFLPAWCAWQGGKVTEIPVKHHPRLHGKSHYGFNRTFKVIIDLMTLKFFSGYLTKPNYLFSGIGLLFFILGTAAGVLAILDKFGPDLYPQFRIPLMLLAVFFGLVAVFLVLMGFLAELMVRLYFQVRNQKSYRLSDE